MDYRFPERITIEELEAKNKALRAKIEHLEDVVGSFSTLMSAAYVEGFDQSYSKLKICFDQIRMDSWNKSNTKKLKISLDKLIQEKDVL